MRVWVVEDDEGTVLGKGWMVNWGHASETWSRCQTALVALGDAEDVDVDVNVEAGCDEEVGALGRA